MKFFIYCWLSQFILLVHSLRDGYAYWAAVDDKWKIMNNDRLLN